MTDTHTQDPLHNEIANALRSRGRRYTANLREIVSALAAAGQPLTLTGVLERCDSLSQSSAYRSLAVLEEAGVVLRLAVSAERAHFELAEHLGEHHHHLVCLSCDRVTDVVLTPSVEMAISEGLASVADEHGFSVNQHTLDAIGRCAECTGIDNKKNNKTHNKKNKR